MSEPLYWICLKCTNIGVVYRNPIDGIYSDVERIDGDHRDASDDQCKLDLAKLVVSREPTKRHAEAEREATAEVPW